MAGTPSPELQKKMAEVLDAFSNNRYDEALAKLVDAQKMKPNDPELINLEGAIYVKQEKWQQATDAFNRALSFNAKYFPAQFNTGEVLYLQKKYADARAVFQKLQADQPKNELLKYKIFLTYLMEGNDADAKAQLDKFDFVADTPAFLLRPGRLVVQARRREAGGELHRLLAPDLPPGGEQHLCRVADRRGLAEAQGP